MEIYKQGRFTTINENTSSTSFKQLLGFLKCNQGNDCFTKFQGKVWKITKDNKWEYVCNNIPDLSYIEYLNISKQ